MNNHSNFCRTLALVLLVAFCLSCVTGCGFLSSGNPQPDQINYRELTVSAAQRFSNGDAKNLRKLFDKDLKKEFSVSALNLAFYEVKGYYGQSQYYQADNIKISNQEGSVVATVPCVREFGKLLLTFIFNNRGEVISFYWVDGTTPSVSPLLENDVEITFGGEDMPLNGCLTLPQGEGPFPCVILLPGLTYGDRNEQVGPNMPLRDMAEQLSADGIASFRYDRRDYTYSAEMAQLSDYTISDWILYDLQAALDYLQAQDSILADYIFLAGHGLSGYLMPMFAQMDDRSAGYILLSAPARTIDQVLYDQTEYVLNADKATDEKAKKTVLSSLEKTMQTIAEVQAKDNTSKEDLMGIPKSVWLELRGYHPLEEITAVTAPVLIIQGGRDYQTNLEDFEGWKAATEQAGMNTVDSFYFDNLNHLYMTGSGKSMPSEYQVAGKVEKAVTDEMASFVLNQTPGKLLGYLLQKSEPEETNSELTDAEVIIQETLLNEAGLVP